MQKSPVDYISIPAGRGKPWGILPEVLIYRSKGDGKKHTPQYGIAFDDCKEHRRKTQCQRTHREHIPKGHIKNVAPRNTPKTITF